MMRTVRRMAFACTISVLVLMWSAQGGDDEAIAQQRVPTLTSMYTGPDGLTYFKEIPFPTGLQKVSAIQFNDGRGRTPNAATLAFHTAPSYRRYVVTLSGKAEIVGSGGNTLFIADKDHIVLAEDTTGKGHTTKGIDWVTMFVEIGDPTSAAPASRLN